MTIKPEIIGVRVDPTSYSESVSQIILWAQNGESRYVCITNVNNIMEAHDSPKYKQVMNKSDISTPDGMPLVWVLRLKGFRKQQRVYGPELMMRVLEAASEAGVPVGFYGATPEVLSALQERLEKRFPSLRIAYAWSPPFRELNREEDQAVTEEINSSGARILFVGLGCPKQEYWVAEHKERVQAVMLAVGAAFDFHAGSKPQAPTWMQNTGLEWLFRLASEPKRLWRRYLKHNPRFLVMASLELIGLYKPKRTG